MNKIDIFLLTILSHNDRLCLKKIAITIDKINLDKPPSRSGLYKRLEVLKTQEMIEIEWKLGKKQYLISTQGLRRIKKLTNQLIKMELEK
jgi:hypothetical protein